MAPVLSKYLTSNPDIAGFLQKRIALTAGAVTVLFWIASVHRNNQNRRDAAKERVQYVINEKSRLSKEKVQVDAVFLQRIFKILKIIIPGVFSPEMGYVLLVAGTLITRSVCDIWMIQNGTSIESAIIGQSYPLFKQNLTSFVVAMPLISMVNNLLKLGLDELKLRFRTRLSCHLYDQYLKEFTYYKMNNLDNRISNPDQLLTTDVERFCSSITELYSNISKPLLDIIIYVQRLSATIGGQGPGIMVLYLFLSGVLLTHLRRPVSRMTVTEQQLEGEFRYVNSRLITNAEEVAFYKGNKREKVTMLTAFRRLVNHLRRFLEFRFTMGFVDNIIAKYFATVVGFYVVSRPFFSKTHPFAKASANQRLEEYYKSGRMLVKLAEAIGRLVLAGRELTRLAGFTSRVTELMTVLKDLNSGRYQRTMVTNESSEEKVPRRPLIPGAGRIINKDNVIHFDRVPLVTPNGDMLIEDLSFEVHSGMNVLVCGPNGCGKSSLFRVLGELWPVFGGTLTKPGPGKLFYIPQRPYMTLGTLRDQIIYPDTYDDMVKRGIRDSDLLTYLDLVKLTYIQERDGGWDAVADWMDVLSGGEKQRIAMARLFYHKPQFAILDECTSAVSVDVEGSMYQYCRQVGITLFTVSHRRSLWQHHEYYLHMDGRGNYEFKPIDLDTIEFGS
nr:ABCD3 protein [Diaphanosoma celebensis]